MWLRRHCWSIGERMRFTKKGVSSIGLLAEIVIVLAVIIILLAIVLVPRFFQQSEIVGEQLGGIQGDADKDGTQNMFDKCPCTFGENIYDGCPTTITEAQKQEDVKKYNNEPPCQIASEAAVGVETTAVEKVGKEDSQPETQFKKYQSIELFGNDDNDPNLPQDGIIRLACTGFVGGTGAVDCHSEDEDCDGEFNLQPLKDGCWIMGSEDDNEGNDCGQVKITNGRIISFQEYFPLKVNLPNDYQSKSNDDDPKNIFQWAWKSKPEYGSLLCDQGFWHGCAEAQEGKTKQV